ncbi:MAG: T9SS type A sorting domain-containing protein [Saprospiraceae bacterium]
MLVPPTVHSAPGRARPEKQPDGKRHRDDPSCYPFPGNTRAGGHQNPQYTDPAAGRVFFYRENPAMLNVTIFDATGRMMLQQAISPENQSLGIGHLTPGLYFVKSQSGDTFVTRKLHVIR